MGYACSSFLCIAAVACRCDVLLECCCSCWCRSATAASAIGKAHLSDPDIESKVQGALAEGAPLVTNGNSSSSGGGKEAAGGCKGGGVLHNFFGSSLFR